MIKTPFYKLEDNIKEIVSKSVIYFRDMGLDNFSFEYIRNHELYEVHLREYKPYWEMVILKNNAGCRDIYRVSFDGIIEYDYSEED